MALTRSQRQQMASLEWDTQHDIGLFHDKRWDLCENCDRPIYRYLLARVGEWYHAWSLSVMCSGSPSKKPGDVAEPRNFVIEELSLT